MPTSPKPIRVPAPRPAADDRAISCAETIRRDGSTDATCVDPRAQRRDAAADATTVDPRTPPWAAHASPAATPTAAAPSPGPGATAVRTTILPRVQIVDDRPQLVHQERRRFEVLRPLGEGGAGEVAAAMDHDIGRPVAVKRIRAELRSPEALARFVEEIRTIGRLEHPNIIPIHDVGIDELGDYYFVMKYVDGETLESIIGRLRAGGARAHAEYPFERRVQIFRGLLEAVAFAHAQGIVHRDIKPANVMVGRFGEVLLMDWGIARPLRGDAAAIDDALRERDPAAAPQETARGVRTQLGTLIGTPAYMSPEQARGEPVDERSDVYSLCVVLHEFLCLHHYLEDLRTVDEVLAGVRERIAPLPMMLNHPAQPTVSADLSWYVRKGLAKDPAERFPSVAAMIERLDRRDEGLIPIQCPLTFTKRTTRGMLRFVDHHPWLYLGGATITLGAIVAGVIRLAL